MKHVPDTTNRQLSPSRQSLPHWEHWIPFVVDQPRASYSYVLPFATDLTSSSLTEPPPPNSWTTETQLDDWFDALHPSQYPSDDSSWTTSSYQGERLLRQTAWATLNPQCTCEYGYSDTWQPRATSPHFMAVIQELSHHIEQLTGCSFNACNLNYYPQGGGVGFHADDEFLFDGLRRPTHIVSLSLCRGSTKEGAGSSTSSAKYDENGSVDKGGARKFQVRQKSDDSSVITQEEDTLVGLQEIVLRHGDIMTMEGMFQKHYFHSVWPGDSKENMDDPYTQGERINLTWRRVVQHLDGSKECRGKCCSLAHTNAQLD